MTSFTLKSDDDFKNRQKKVFEQLSMLETSIKIGENDSYTEEKMETEVEERDTQQSRAYWDAKRASKQDKSKMRQFKGKESIFKKPQHPAPRNFINRIPDFKKNPHKWTKYSLEDVAEVTDESNKKSAMGFLRELADRKRLESGESIEEKLEKLPTKIIFKKHTAKSLKKEIVSSTVESQKDDKSSFQNSKQVMPEYVIGQKTKKEKNNRKKEGKPQKGRELKLDHLAFEDDDE